jgi:pimeloyl-ACP methyl ester carboxylesterase
LNSYDFLATLSVSDEGVVMIKKLLSYFVSFILFLLILPYFIPRDFSTAIPDQPYSNSVFFTTNDGSSLHGQLFLPEQTLKGKIIMIHGLGASSFSYRNNAPYFAEQGYLVLAVDLPAFGYSSKARGIQHSQIQRADYLWQWLNNIDASFINQDAWHLVGHSMGGSTVLAMANQNPSATASMNLIAGAVTNNNPNVTWILRSPIGEWLKVALRYAIITEDRFASILESAYNQVPDAAAIKGYLAPLQTQGTPTALVEFVMSAQNVLITELNQNNIPLNLLWGEKDTWVDLEQIDIIASHAQVNVLHIFKNEGHCVHETSPDFNQILLNALVKSSN